MPGELIDFLAGQLQIADPSCLKRYSVRDPMHRDREHAEKIQKALALKDFAEVESELAVFVGRRAWVTGDGPKAIFADAVGGGQLSLIHRCWNAVLAGLTGQPPPPRILASEPSLPLPRARAAAYRF